MTSTAMAMALKKAGVRTPEDLLASYAAKAVAAHPGDLSAALNDLFHNVCEEPRLLVHVFQPLAEQALGQFIRDAVSAKADRRLGRIEDGHRGGDAGSATHSPSGEGRAGQHQPAAQFRAARPAANPPRGAAAIASVSRVVALSYLNRIVENGKHLGDCTKEDLEGMAKTNAHRAYLYGALAHSLPPTAKVHDCFDDAAISEIDRKWNGAAS